MISKKIPVFSLLATAILCVFMASSAVPAAVIDKVIVVVNDEVVTQREFDRMFEPVRQNYEQNFKGEELEKRLTMARKGLLEQLINSKLAISLAKKEKVEIDETELAARIDKIKAFYPDEKEFLKALSDRGTNLTEFERDMREQMLAQKIVEQEVAGKIVITPVEVSDLYEKNKEKMVSPHSVKLRGIMVRRQEGDAEAGKQKAAKLAAKAKKGKGKDFAELAKNESEGPFADRGGDMGYVVKGQMVQEIDDVVFDLKKGQISDVVETQLGYHIFFVEDIQESRPLEFDEVSDFLKNQLYKRKFEAELVKWLEDKRKNAYISYK